MENKQEFDFENFSVEPELMDYYYEVYDGKTDFFESEYFKPRIHKTMNNISSFTLRQQELIEVGNLNTQLLKQIVEVAMGVKKVSYEAKRHTYIYSLPGAGKTYTTSKTAQENGVALMQIRGSASIPAFARKLAYWQMCAGGKPITVWIDDCDMLFVDEENINVMKGVLDEDINLLAWNKNMTPQIQRDLASEDVNTQMIGRAMQMFQPAGSPGLEIPTDNVRFIITSNKNLCEPSKLVSSASKRIVKRDMHEAAIRDRINYKAFELNDEDSWGWIASTLMQPTFVLDEDVALSDHEKWLILDFMYKHWPRLTSTSLRAAKDLAAQMKNNPTTYPAIWDMGLKKSNSRVSASTFTQLFEVSK